MSLLGLVLACLVLFVAIWAVQQLAGTFGVPDQIRVVIVVLIVVFFVLWIVSGFSGNHFLRLT